MTVRKLSEAEEAAYRYLKFGIEPDDMPGLIRELLSQLDTAADFMSDNEGLDY